MASTRKIELKKWNNSSVRGYSESRMIGHRRPNGSDALSILSEEHKNASTRGENAAGGQTTPESVVEGWMRSPGHRANILHKSYKSIGVGVCCYFGSFCWIQLFTSHKNPTAYHPNGREEVTVQISLDPSCGEQSSETEMHRKHPPDKRMTKLSDYFVYLPRQING